MYNTDPTVTTSQQLDLLDLELSHDAEDDVSRPIQQNDDQPLFNYNLDDDETTDLLGNNIDTKIDDNKARSTESMENANKNKIDASNAKCWNVEFYQSYFDIDTSDELQRLKKALIPFLSGPFLDKELGEKADLLSPSKFCANSLLLPPNI